MRVVGALHPSQSACTLELLVVGIPATEQGSNSAERSGGSAGFVHCCTCSF